MRWPVLPIALSLAASAQAAMPAIDVPAGTLGHSLTLLARQAKVNIGTSDPRIATLPVPGVRGDISIGTALNHLLARSGAIATQTGLGGWRIVSHPARSPAQPTVPPRMTASSIILVMASKRAIPLSLYAGVAHILPADAMAPAGSLPGSIGIDQRIASVESTHFGTGRDKLFVRGIADSGFTGPSQSSTGQYLNDTRLTYNAPDPALRPYDIAAIEVLEGPQATLYGAGALGGVVRVITRRPQLDHFRPACPGGPQRRRMAIRAEICPACSICPWPMATRR